MQKLLTSLSMIGMLGVSPLWWRVSCHQIFLSLPFVCCPLLLKVSACVIWLSPLSLLCVSSPYRTVFSNAKAFDQQLCSPSWVLSRSESTDQTNMFEDNTGGSIATSACCPAETYHIPGTWYCTPETNNMIKFTSRDVLKEVVDKCLRMSPKGDCCLPDSSSPNPDSLYLYTGTSCRHRNKIQAWDVSEVDDMSTRELTFVVYSPLCPLVQSVCSCNLTLCFLSLLCNFFLF